MDTPTSPPPAAGHPPPPPPYGTSRPRQLRRRPDQGPIAGVCAGVAEYFAIDPVIVRIAAVVLAVSGPGIVAYGLAWIFVPEADLGPGPRSPLTPDRHDRGTQILGIVLLALSVSVLWGGWWSPARRWMFPLGLMALGAWLLLRSDRDDKRPGDDEDPEPRADAPTSWSGPAAAGVVPLADTGPSASVPVDVAGAPDDTWVTDADTTLVAPVDAAAGGPGDPNGPSGPTPSWGRGADPAGRAPEGPEATASRRRRRLLLPGVIGALLLWTGTAFLTGVGPQTGLAVALCIVGLGFVLGAFVGGSWALIVPAVVVAGALMVTTVVDIPLSGPVGRRTWAPQSVAQVADHYELSVGEGVLDLSGLDLGRGDDVDVAASIGVGHLRVEVPAGVAVEVHARAGAGETLLLGESSSGVGVEVDRTYGQPGAGTLHLDLEVGLGQVEMFVRHLDGGASEPTTSPEPTGAPEPTTPSTAAPA